MFFVFSVVKLILLCHNYTNTNPYYTLYFPLLVYSIENYDCMDYNYRHITHTITKLWNNHLNYPWIIRLFINNSISGSHHELFSTTFSVEYSRPSIIINSGCPLIIQAIYNDSFGASLNISGHLSSFIQHIPQCVKLPSWFIQGMPIIIFFDTIL